MKVKKKVLRYQGQDRCRCGGRLGKRSYNQGATIDIIKIDLHVCERCGQIYRERGKGNGT